MDLVREKAAVERPERGVEALVAGGRVPPRPRRKPPARAVAGPWTAGLAAGAAGEREVAEKIPAGLLFP